MLPQQVSECQTSVYWLQQTEADVPSGNDWLSAGEMLLLNRLRFAKRRSDWRLGRWTAKCAAAIYLNLLLDPKVLSEIEVRPSAAGAPEIWCGSELAPVSISLSHRAGRGLCAVGRFGIALGCDLEMIEPHSEAFTADFFASEEQAQIERTPLTDRPRLASLLWSAKESALKALRTGLRLDTRSVVVSLLNGNEIEPSHETESGLQETPGFLSSQSYRGWCPLQVRHADGQVFSGWWQQDGELLRTFVAAVPVPRPIRLEVASSLPVAGAAR